MFVNYFPCDLMPEQRLGVSIAMVTVVFNLLLFFILSLLCNMFTIGYIYQGVTCIYFNLLEVQGLVHDNNSTI